MGHSTWRHVKFVEGAGAGFGGNAGEQASGSFPLTCANIATHAGCLEACPTGAIVRTEFGGVFIQPDVCNGCGYCVVSCPFGVVERNPRMVGLSSARSVMTGRKWIASGLCAGVSDGVDQIRRDRPAPPQANERIDELHRRGINDAALYDPERTSVGGTHALFIVRGDPRTYNLPPSPEAPTVYLKKSWTASAVAAGLLLGGTLLAFLRDAKVSR